MEIVLLKNMKLKKLNWAVGYNILYFKNVFLCERAIGLVVSALHLGPKVQGQALKR